MNDIQGVLANLDLTVQRIAAAADLQGAPLTSFDGVRWLWSWRDSVGQGANKATVEAVLAGDIDPLNFDTTLEVQGRAWFDRRPSVSWAKTYLVVTMFLGKADALEYDALPKALERAWLEAHQQAEQLAVLHEARKALSKRARAALG